MDLHNGKEGIYMPKRGLNIYKRKDGRWEGRYPIVTNGTIKYKSVYAPTYKQVKEKLLLQQESAKEIFNFYNGISASLTFEAVTYQWLSRMKSKIKESTFSLYSFYVYKHLIPDWGKMNIHTLTKQDVTALFDKKITCGKFNGEGLSESSIKTLFYVVQSILNFAFDNQYLNPFDIPKPSVKAQKAQTCIIHKNEQMTLEAYVISHPTPQSLGILLSLYTGLRIGELCALRWKNVDIKEGYLTVEHTLQRIQINDTSAKTKTKIIMSTPKSQSSCRTVPLSQQLIEILSQYYPECPEDAFFLTGKEQHFLEPRSYTAYFHSILKKCGLRKINFHACRHTFATRCIESGIDPKTVSELLGHTTVTMTLNKYVHSNLELQRKAVEKLSFCKINIL